MPRVCLVARQEPGTTGTSRYVAALAPRLEGTGYRVTILSTDLAGFQARALHSPLRLGLDLRTFLASYPIWMHWPMADVYHLSGQTLASALLFKRPPGPVLVTVHDIIPYLVRHDRALRVYRHRFHQVFDWLALRGLHRADALIADSDWTKRTMLQHLGVTPDRVTTVPPGVDTRRFRPMAVPPAFLARHGLPADLPIVLYVGSEDPRKNLTTLWRAFAHVQSSFPGACLVKVGRSHHPSQRSHLERIAADLGTSNYVLFLDEVAEADLPLLYNAAAVYVQPSLYEGFGLPVLEALACGTRVVASRTSSLPELASPDTITCEPTVTGLAHAIERALSEGGMDGSGTTERRSWAGTFTWERTAESVARLYDGLRAPPGAG
jgi:glycosyltransferase involved in cell wall biosynthesis